MAFRHDIITTARYEEKWAQDITLINPDYTVNLFGNIINNKLRHSHGGLSYPETYQFHWNTENI